MHPLFQGQIGLGTNADRIARPKVDQGPFQFSFLNQKFIPTTRRIGPSLRAMQHYGALLHIGGLNPKRQTKRIFTLKVPQRRVHGIIPSKLNRLTKLPGHELIFTFEDRGWIFRSA